ncbi:efflux RND transporter periplasmic adaptor subunit [Patescibacteria group bacterium]
MRKKIIWISIICLLIGGIFWFMNRGDSDKEYITANASLGDVSQVISVTGEVVSKNRVDISSEISGEVEDVFVKVGDYVEKGQQIAKIDTSILISQLREVREALRVKEEAEKLVRRQWDDNTPEQRSSAIAATNQARQAVRTAEKRVQRGNVFSPIEGLVSSLKVEKGELAIANGVISTVLRDDLLEIEAEVPESDIAELEVGQMATLEFDAFDMEDSNEVNAKISQIYPAATIIQDVVYYKVKLEIVGSDARIRPGMSVDIDVLTSEKKGILTIPGQAVKQINGEKFVTILSESNEEERRMIESGIRSDDGVIEIISGIKEGERVVILVKE